MPNDDAVLRYCHAWQTAEAAGEDHKSGDDDADDKKSSYKFPHHKTKGGPANLAACRNGLARLESANIPDADRAGVKAHLQAHLDDANKGGDDDGKSDNAAGFQLVDESAWAQAVRLGNLVGADRVHEHAARAHTVSDRTEFYQFSNIAGPVAQLDIYDGIGWYGVNAADFSQQLRAVTAPVLNVHINSPGGDVFDAIAMTNMLRAHASEVHVVIDGLAASAASFLAQAGKTVTMMPNSQMMIHDASGLCVGNQADMLDFAQLLDRNSNNIASIYAARAGGTTDQWREAMRAETWYSAEEAVAAGLADRVGDTESPSEAPDMSARWTLNFYNYAGRSAAPAPKPIAAAAVQPQIEPVAADPVLTIPAPTTVTNTSPPTAGTESTPTSAAAPAENPAAQPAADDTPVWDASVFRLALKERAAQQ